MVSAGALITLAPLMATAALANKIGRPTESAFYSAHRIGQGGREISIYKIRSMSTTSSSETHFSEIDKSRINRFGRLLRRSGFDETPQLLSVLKGDLSLVGPRVMPQWEIDLFQNSLDKITFNKWYQDYLSARPGGTGLHQILGNKDLSYGARARLDTFYCQHANFGLDLYILMSSVWVAAKGKGIY